MSEQVKLKQRLEYSERRRTRMQKLLLQRPQEEDTFLWSMVDIVTLLLVFFIFLYTNASSRILEQEPKQATITKETKSARVEIVPQQPVPDINLRRDVDSLLADNQAFSVRWDEARPVFVLGENITFEVGRAELIADFESSLTDLANFIARHPSYRVVVAGHTDDAPISTSQFPSNWELSAARAASVTKFLAAHEVEPWRISVQGHAEYEPLEENTTPENRQANRRVEITLVKQDTI